MKQHKESFLERSLNFTTPTVFLSNTRCAEQRGFTIDQPGFEKLMEDQRIRSKEGSKMSAEIFASSGLDKIPSGIPATTFLGYDVLETKARDPMVRGMENRRLSFSIRPPLC